MLPGKVMGATHTVTAADVTATTITVDFSDWLAVTSVIVEVKTAAGALKAWDGVATITGGVVVVDNTGSTDWADTDVISIVAIG